MIKVVNPLNREETNMDTAAYGCHCVCYSTNGSGQTHFWASLPWDDGCACSCQDGNSSNHNANSNAAYNANH